MAAEFLPPPPRSSHGSENALVVRSFGLSGFVRVCLARRPGDRPSTGNIRALGAPVALQPTPHQELPAALGLVLVALALHSGALVAAEVVRIARRDHGARAVQVARDRNVPSMLMHVPALSLRLGRRVGLRVGGRRISHRIRRDRLRRVRRASRTLASRPALADARRIVRFGVDRARVACASRCRRDHQTAVAATPSEYKKTDSDFGINSSCPRINASRVPPARDPQEQDFAARRTVFGRGERRHGVAARGRASGVRRPTDVDRSRARGLQWLVAPNYIAPVGIGEAAELARRYGCVLPIGIGVSVADFGEPLSRPSRRPQSRPPTTTLLPTAAAASGPKIYPIR